MEKGKYKHFFFDMDGTVTESRQPMERDMCEALLKLEGDITFISGAERSRMKVQLNPLHRMFGMMAESGADSYPHWRSELYDCHNNEIQWHINDLFRRFGYFFEPHRMVDLKQSRTCQVTLGLVPPDFDIELKKQVDPDQSIRKKMLEIVPFVSLTGIEVRIGGLTSFDYTQKEFSKGKSIQKMIDIRGWKKEDCIYFGDALFEGGNDSSVIGIIDTQKVANPEDTLSILNKII